MKKILCFLLLTGIPVLASAQTFKTSLTSQGWAGGICCRTGTNYTLTISGNAAELEKLEITAVCVDKKYFDSIQASAVSTVNGKSQRTYHFSYSRNGNEYPNPDESENKSCDENRIYLEKNKFLMIESRSELPYIAYP